MVTTRSQADAADKSVKDKNPQQDQNSGTPKKLLKKKQVNRKHLTKENQKMVNFQLPAPNKETKVTNPRMVTPVKKEKNVNTISYPVVFNEYTPGSVINLWNRTIKSAMISKWYNNTPKDIFMQDLSPAEIEQEMEVIQAQMTFDKTVVAISKEEEQKFIKHTEGHDEDDESSLESKAIGNEEEEVTKESTANSMMDDLVSTEDEETALSEDGLLDDTSIVSDSTNTDSTMTVLCHSLSQVTRNSTIARWPVRALIQIINKRNEEYEMYLPFQHLQELDPSILRRIVRDTRDDMQEKNSTEAYISEVPVTEGTFNENTPSWELHSYNYEDIQAIYRKYVHVTKAKESKLVQQLTKDEYRDYLVEAKDKMNANQLPWTNVNIHLSVFEGNVEKAIAQFKHKLDMDNQSHFLLNGSTEDNRILKWNPHMLKQFIVIWKAKQKLKLKIPVIEKVPANLLRRIVMTIRDEIKQSNNSEVLHVETAFYETINPMSKKWEIDAFSLAEQKQMLNLLAEKLNKSYEVDDMTSEEVNSSILEMLASDKVRTNAITLDCLFPAANQVNQSIIDSQLSTKKKYSKKIIQLSKVTSKASIVEWSAKVLVELMILKNPKMKATDKFKLIKEPTPTIRSKVLGILNDLQVGQKSDIYKSTDERTGFFGYLTLDWEIKGYSTWETQDLIKQTRNFFQVTVSPGNDNDIASLKKELMRFRDSLKDESNSTFFNLSTIKDPTIKKKRTGKTKHNNRQADLEEQASHVKLGAYVSYNKEETIKKFHDHFQDISQGDIVEIVDCVPVLTRTTEDIIIGSWPPKNRIEILQQAGLNCDGQDCMELLHSLKNLRNSLSPSKEVRALTPYYGFFTRNTKDSQLWSRSTHDLKMIYILYCGRFGIKLTLQLLESVGKQDLIEELQMIRSLIIQKVDYHFDLCIAAVQKGDLSMEEASVREMHIQIARRVKAYKVERNQKFSKPQQDSRMGEIGDDDEDPDIEDDGEEHIKGLTADWEINNLSLNEAREEIQYQYRLMSKKPIRESMLNSMTRNKLLEKLFDIRDMHKRIYNAFNLQPEDECNQDDMLSEESTDNLEDMNSEKNDTQESSDDEMEDDDTESQEDSLMTDSTELKSEANLITQEEESDEESENNDMQDVSEEESSSETSESINHEMEEDSSDIEGQFQEVKSKKKKQKKMKEQSGQGKHKSDNEFQLGPKDQMEEATKVDYCYLRVKMETSTRAPHVATFLKKVVHILRTHDDSFQILPFDTSQPLNSDTIIVHEDQFPDTTAYLSDWVRGILVNRNQKLCFSLRITTKKQFKTIKSDIHEIINSEGWYINFDHIEAPTVFLMGWLKGIHPRLHNRDYIRHFIESRLPYTKNKIHLYYRTVWENDEKGKSVGTEGIAIDGAAKNRSKMFEDIANLPWNSEYGDVIFVPMKCSKNFTLAHKITVFGQQNTYIHHTRSRAVQLVENPVLKVMKGRNIYFQDWILQQTVDNVKFLQKAETYPNNTVRLIYHEDFDHIVEEVIANLYANVERAFSTAAATRILGPASKQFAKLATYNKKAVYDKKVAKAIETSTIKVRKLERKTPRTSQQQQQPTSMSYAAAAVGNNAVNQKAPPVQLNTPIHTTKVETRVKELEAMVQQNKFDEQKLTAKLQDEFKKELDKTKQGLEAKMRKDKDDTMSAIKKSTKKMEKKLEEKEKSFTSQLQAITSMIWETKEETTVQSSAVERIEQNQNRLLSVMERLTQNNPNTNNLTPPIRAVEQSSCHGVAR